MTRLGNHRSPGLALACTLATASACTLRYDPDDLGDGAEPGALRLEQVTPQLIFEGQGAAMNPSDVGLVRAVPVVLRGSNFTADMAISLDGESFDGGEVPFTVSTDGHWAAFELRIPVNEERGGGVDLPLAVRVTKGDEEQEGSLVRRMLPELVQDGGEIESVDEDGLSLYSQVALSGTVAAAGTRPVRLIGYAGIAISGQLSADGAGQEAGAGGCSGAVVAADAGCGAGSGRRGQDAIEGLGAVGGGGGGGFGAADAQRGGGEERGGDPGEPTAAPVLVPMPPASQGPAGGGGGGRVLALGGGGGGGSGGIVELTSPAVIQVDGAVSADGASPGPCADDSGGGGGGGSGGAILIRAGAGLLTATGASIHAVGGVGGSVSCNVAGGDGGTGLIRIDRPDETLLDADPAVVPGPAFALDNQVILTEGPDLSISIRGKPGSSYNLRVTGFDRETNDAAVSSTLVATPSGVGGATVPLWAGHNELCVEADPATTYPESQNCLTIAYLP